MPLTMKPPPAQASGEDEKSLLHLAEMLFFIHLERQQIDFSLGVSAEVQLFSGASCENTATAKKTDTGR